ncbi:LysR substrate-binding domain-containing protein [Aestuariibacter sp. AA17]|uniref:LysR substrate-binding domain-containing protein n=1 Tax=Fluctibacter corallii TaxID=2984329 RepID=A0ABT3A760_9ALTE|nr:LysR family transcriptional regulator [Aestuariibacter sp. AA17]MCV2884122.1 LysR substrate-binding domain-containing protein [Aestuariibacter sp. AA17]
MDIETIELSSLRYFVVTAEHLNFTRASEQLGMAKSKLSKEILKLEDVLGTPVFERTSRVVRLTEVGHLLYQRATVLLEDASHLVNDIRTMQDHVAGHLRLAAPPALGRFISSNLLPEFMNQWPDVSVSLRLSYSYEDLFKEGVDLAFRMGSHQNDNLIVKPLGQANRVIVASPDYIANHPTITEPEDLSQHRAVQMFAASKHHWTLKHQRQTTQVPMNNSFQCDDFVALIEMIKSGVGIGQLPWLTVREHVRRGELAILLPGWFNEGLPISLVYRQGYNKPRKLAEFIRCIDANASRFDLRYPN